LLFSVGRAEDSRWDELIQAGNAAMQAKRYAEAEKNYREALAEASTGDPHDPKVVDSLRKMAEVNSVQGKTLQQEPFLRRILAFEEDTRGHSDSQLVPPLLSLSSLYLELQRPGDAEPYVRRALEISENTLGPTNGQTLDLVNNLGHICLELRRYTEAEELFRRSLQAHQDIQPPNRDAAVNDLKNLYGVFALQGRDAEAEALLRQAKEYEDSARVGAAGGSREMDRMLGNSYWMQQRYAEAEPLLLHWLETEEKSMGPNHPNVLFALSEIERFYRVQGREAEADAYAQRAAEVASKLKQEEKGGGNVQEDPQEYMKLMNTAGTLMGQGQFAEAEKLYQKVLSNLKRTGETRPMTVANTMMSVGMAKCLQGNYQEAVPIFKQSIEMAERTMGHDHPQAIELYRLWGRCQSRIGMYGEADNFYRQLIQRLDKPGKVQPGVLLGVLGDYIWLLQNTDRAAEANQFIELSEKVRSQLRQENPAPQ
jgi:tetratricopeptide (TPR) repeat protein